MIELRDEEHHEDYDDAPLRSPFEVESDSSDFTESSRSRFTALSVVSSQYNRVCKIVELKTRSLFTQIDEKIGFQRLKIFFLLVIIAITGYIFIGPSPSNGEFELYMGSVEEDTPIERDLLYKTRPTFVRLALRVQSKEYHNETVRVWMNVYERRNKTWNLLIQNAVSLLVRQKTESSQVKILPIPPPGTEHDEPDDSSGAEQEDDAKRKYFETRKVDSDYHLKVRIQTTTVQPIGLEYSFTPLPALAEHRVALAFMILVGVYTVIIFEVIHRAIAAMFGSFVALAALSMTLERPSLSEAANWIDINSCGLLFGMMIMVGILSKTGCFEWAAIKLYKLSNGKIWVLLVSLCSLLAILAAFLDNVTTILLLAPVSIKLCKVLRISPFPLLLSEIMVTNISGTLTAIADPSDVIIVSYKPIQDDGHVNFTSFAMHVTPIGVICCVVAIAYVFHQYKDELERKKEDEKELLVMGENEENNEENENGIELDENGVVHKRKSEPPGRSSAHYESPVEEIETIEQLEEKYVIKDKNLLIKSVLVIGFVLVLFFIRTPINLNLSLTWIAIIGAIVHMIVTGTKNVEEILEKVEWGALLFFGSLFVLMRALEELGLMQFLAEVTAKIIGKFPAGDTRLIAAVVFLIWMTAIVSAFIENIPFTTAMVPVIVQLSNDHMGLPLSPLAWALVFGGCYGGNATIMASAANVIAISIAEQEGYKITFAKFSKLGVPVVFITCTIASLYMIVLVLFGWHEEAKP
eukprot:TRINITY_DN14613_c0_g1_i1.p1 TRINITY_DN14613_c0_g1~~TRINITY_DN14613_c0_g1_i1.p1  ORF type:complete len:750 (-),score=144.70 TRINITY_DN14613_c0_g1_i1:25-2274(-)